MNKAVKLLIVTSAVGLIGSWIIRAFIGRNRVKNLEKLLGEEWVKNEMICDQPKHFLGRWYKKSADNPITRYADELADFILNSGSVKCVGALQE